MSLATNRVAAERQAWMQRLLPDGVPTLWCPLLTHYADDGALDRPRMRAQLDFLRSSVKGFLIPGSTGDAWELSDAETRELLEFAVAESAERRFALLIGVLKPTTAEMLADLAATTAWLRRRSGTDDTTEALRRASVCGFTVCPPRGAGLPQRQIRDDLDRILATGLPFSLYQLPQVTGNEMAPETVAWLAARHPNLLLLKDTSGADRVAASGLRDVFLVRGAEGDYGRHLAMRGGAYDGFLLSTANAFGPQYARMIDDLREGRTESADAMSARIAALAGEVFEAAARVPQGNAFTNANKALDHFMAHGPCAAGRPAPRLHGGDRLPDDLIALAGAALTRHGLMPTCGYLER
jgi:dihydrodipicolinate synthase/N-acetylneuraminate lyase